MKYALWTNDRQLNIGPIARIPDIIKGKVLEYSDSIKELEHQADDLIDNDSEKNHGGFEYTGTVDFIGLVPVSHEDIRQNEFQNKQEISKNDYSNEQNKNEKNFIIIDREDNVLIVTKRNAYHESMENSRSNQDGGYASLEDAVKTMNEMVSYSQIEKAGYTEVDKDGKYVKPKRSNEQLARIAAIAMYQARVVRDLLYNTNEVIEIKGPISTTVASELLTLEPPKDYISDRAKVILKNAVKESNNNSPRELLQRIEKDMKMRVDAAVESITDFETRLKEQHAIDKRLNPNARMPDFTINNKRKEIFELASHGIYKLDNMQVYEDVRNKRVIGLVEVESESQRKVLKDQETGKIFDVQNTGLKVGTAAHISNEHINNGHIGEILVYPILKDRIEEATEVFNKHRYNHQQILIREISKYADTKEYNEILKKNPIDYLTVDNMEMSLEPHKRETNIVELTVPHRFQPVASEGFEYYEVVREEMKGIDLWANGVSAEKAQKDIEHIYSSCKVQLNQDQNKDQNADLGRTRQGPRM